MAALNIIGVENAPYHDGLNLQVTLDRDPTGTVAFYASPLPSVQQVSGNLKTAAVDPGAQARIWKVKCRAGTQNEPARVHRMPFYVRAVDDVGPSLPHGDWLCAGLNTDWLNQVDHALQDILIANAGMLDRSMTLALGSGNWPSGRAVAVRKIHRGQPQNEEGAKFPRLCHQATSINEDYLGGGSMEAGLPYSDYVPITSQIQCYSLYQSDVEWGFVLAALGMGVFNLLNAPWYYRITLDCGLTLFQCMCHQGSLQEYYDASLDAWVVGFQLTWQGMLHAGKESPDQYPA